MAELDDAFAPLVAAERTGAPTNADLRARVARRRRQRRVRAAGALVLAAAVIGGIATIGTSGKRSIRVTNPTSTTAPTSTTGPTTSTPPPAPGRTATAIGWQVSVPAGWHARVGNVCDATAPGIVVSPEPDVLTPANSAGCYDGGIATPAGLVAVAISFGYVDSSLSATTPSTKLPLSLDSLPPGLTQPEIRISQIVENGAAYLVRAVLAPDAPAAQRALVDATLRSLHLVRGASSGSGLGETAAQLRLPSVVAIAFDAGGNVYLADDTLHRVFELKAGVVVRVIGDGTQGFAGDSGPAADAQLDYPRGLAVDDGQNLYIADSFNNRIRRVTPDGTITTYAGTGAGVSGPDGHAAGETALQGPQDLLYDSITKSLYVAEGSRVRRIGADGIVHTVAGNGQGTIGVLEHAGGLATETSICSPSGIAISTDRSLWIADDCNKSIDRVGPDGHINVAPGFAFRLAAAPDGSVSAYYGRQGGIARVTPTADTPFLQLEASVPVSRCDHYGGQGSDYAGLAWRGDTLYFANPSMGRVCARTPDGRIATITGG